MNHEEDTPSRDAVSRLGNEPASPLVYDNAEGWKEVYPGFTKREVIAKDITGDLIKAMMERRGEPGYTDEGAIYEAVKLAAFTADALLAELNKLQGESTK